MEPLCVARVNPEDRHVRARFLVPVYVFQRYLSFPVPVSDEATHRWINSPDAAEAEERDSCLRGRPKRLLLQFLQDGSPADKIFVFRVRNENCKPHKNCLVQAMDREGSPYTKDQQAVSGHNLALGESAGRFP